MTITQKCKVSWCKRHTPEVYRSQGYCSYHYRVKNEGEDPEKYVIRKKAKPGEPLKFIRESIKKNTNNCILYPHGKDGRGYGSIWYKKKRIKAHRLSLMLHTGYDPDADEFACHTCDIRDCINPRHLYWGDAMTNFHDQMRTFGG